jgi:hypothetical protein
MADKKRGFLEIFKRKTKAKREREIREKREMTPEQRKKLSERDRRVYDAIQARKKRKEEGSYGDF